MTDSNPLALWRSNFNLITDDAAHWRIVDNTALTPESAADAIMAFVKNVQETSMANDYENLPLAAE